MRGFEGLYEVSDAGRVRSLDRVSSFPGRWGPVERTVQGRLLRQNNHSGGYKIVTLWANGASKIKLVHSVVLEAFVGPRPPRMEAAHGDGDRTNNSRSNLRWATPSDNQLDRERHGTGRRGVKRRTRSVGARMAEHIRATHAKTGLNVTQLAKHLALPRTTVADVINQRTWK